MDLWGIGPMGRGAGEKANDFKAAITRLFKELKSFKVLIFIALILAIIGAVLTIMAPDKLKDLTNEIQEGIKVNSDNLELIAKKVTMSSKSAQSIVIDENGNEISELPSYINEMQFEEFEVDGVKISTEDQMKFLEIMSTLDKNADVNDLYSKIDEMPESIQEVVKPKMDMEKIKTMAIVLGTMYVLSAIFTFIQDLAMTDVANKFAKSLRSRISNKINILPLKYFDKHQSGDILSRVTNDVDTIAQSMNQSLATLVSAVVLFVGTIIMMFVTDVTMAVTAILSSLIGFVFMFMILGRSQKYFTARQVELGKLNGHIEEVYSGLNVVKVYNGKKQADSQFDKFNKSVYDANRKSQFLSGLMMPMMNFVGNFGYVAVCIVGALLTMNGKISFGVIIAFITYVRLFTNPLSQIAQAMTSLQSTAAACERVFEFVDEEEMKPQDNITKKLDINRVKGNIEFNHIVFQYDGNDKPTIVDFSATAKHGQKIAIVGPTGARKNYNGKFTYEIL